MQPQLGDAVTRFADLVSAIPDSSLELDYAWESYDEGLRFAFFRIYQDLRDLALTLARARASQGLPFTIAQRALAQFHLAYRDLCAALIGVDDESFSRPLAPQEWPLRMVLSHIIVAETRFFAQIWYAVDQARRGRTNPPTMPSEEVDRFVGSREELRDLIAREPLSDLLPYFHSLHHRILDELASLSDAETELPSRWWEDSPMSVRFRLHRFDAHLRQHTIQVDKTLAAAGLMLSESQRLLRLIYSALAEAEGFTIGAPGLGLDALEKAANSISTVTAEITPLLTAALTDRTGGVNPGTG